ncbi:MAG: sarcosine oxidase subunit delta [Pseudomonadota bacterium]
MRLTCPFCGSRDIREFTYRGDALLMFRPADEAEMHAYVHLRDNPAGPHDELWQHDGGCRAWLKVRRDTTTHEVLSVEIAAEVAR